MNTIKELCALGGISGREKNVRDFIISKLPPDVSYRVDNLGNLLVSKKGRKTPDNKRMICAHMDEVGLIITDITDSGYLKFACVGGVDEAVLIGRRVLLESGVFGVIGLKHIHLCAGEERQKIPSAELLCIDIGADSKEEAEQYAERGSYALFDSAFTEFGSGNTRVCAKALDDRLGCALMLGLIGSDLEYDTEFAFTVQEEVGARGALTATYAIHPDIAIILETTTAGDICGVEGDRRACVLGEGPVVSYMDRGTVYDHELYKKVFQIARDKNILCQTKTLVAGGNDSSSVQRTGNGVRTIAVSVPCRYLHSPVCVIDKRDIEETRKLVYALAEYNL